MARTRITYHEVNVSAGDELDFDHPDGSQVSILGAEHTGGGSLKPTMLRVAVLYAVTPDGEPRTPDDDEPGHRARVRPVNES